MSANIAFVFKAVLCLPILVVNCFKRDFHLPAFITPRLVSADARCMEDYINRWTWVGLQGLSRNPIDNSLEEGRRECRATGRISKFIEPPPNSMQHIPLDCWNIQCCPSVWCRLCISPGSLVGVRALVLRRGRHQSTSRMKQMPLSFCFLPYSSCWGQPRLFILC